MRAVTTAIAVLILVVLAHNLSGQTSAAPVQPARDIEYEKLRFEQQNEDRKNRTELIKSTIAGLSLLLPLCFGIYTLRSQAKQAFELKAAELVMTAPSVFAVEKKARILRTIFTERIPSDFAAAFNPRDFASMGPSVESKLELLKLLVANPSRASAIIDLWRRMYPGDTLQQLFPGDHVRSFDTFEPGTPDDTTLGSNAAPEPPPI